MTISSHGLIFEFIFSIVKIYYSKEKIIVINKTFKGFWYSNFQITGIKPKIYLLRYQLEIIVQTVAES